MIIGVTGPIASGKSEFSKILERYGFSRLALSDLVKEEARKRGLPIERRVLQDIGNELREKYGKGILAEKALKRIDDRDWVIEGIRNPGEVEVLRRKKDFLLVALDSSEEVRFERVKNRLKDSDPKEWKEFLLVEERDRKEGGKGQDVEGCMKMADVTLYNNGRRLEDLEKFNLQVKDFLKKIKRKD